MLPAATKPSLPRLTMHKDPRPGIFDFAARSLRYIIGLGLLTGIILSIFVYVAVFVWRADRGASDPPKANAGELENSMTARRKIPTPTPAPAAAVRY